MMYKTRIISVARPRNTFKRLLLAPAFGVVTLASSIGLAVEPMSLSFGAISGFVSPPFSSAAEAHRKRSSGVAIK